MSRNSRIANKEGNTKMIEPIITLEVAKEVLRQPQIKYPMWAVTLGAVIYLLERFVSLLKKLKDFKKWLIIARENQRMIRKLRKHITNTSEAENGEDKTW